MRLLEKVIPSPFLSIKKTGLEYLETMLKYVVNATDRIRDEELRKIVMETLPEGGNLMPTIAQKWLEGCISAASIDRR